MTRDDIGSNPPVARLRGQLTARQATAMRRRRARPAKDLDIWLTVSELAYAFGLPRSEINRWIRQRWLTCVRVNSRRRLVLEWEARTVYDDLERAVMGRERRQGPGQGRRYAGLRPRQPVVLSADAADMYMTVAEVAKLFGVARQTVHYWIGRERLKAAQGPRGCKVVERGSVEHWKIVHPLRVVGVEQGQSGE